MSRELRTLCGSFKVAAQGIIHCIFCERNMRIHIAAAVGVMLISILYNFSAVHYMILVLLFGIMIAAEMFNTAIERVVDLLSPSYNRLAKLSKDIAAGAVLVCAIASSVIGILLFLDLKGIHAWYNFIVNHPLYFGIGVLSYFSLAWAFVFLPDKNK